MLLTFLTFSVFHIFNKTIICLCCAVNEFSSFDGVVKLDKSHVEQIWHQINKDF